MSARPLVSVVVPAHNAACWIRSAVDSVLCQSWEDYEVIIVDDGSTDGTADTLLDVRSRIRLLRTENRGVSRARNEGIASAHGRLVAFLDADDVWHREKLLRQVTALTAEAPARACCSAFVVADAQLRPRGIRRADPTRPRLADLLITNVIGTPSTVMCDRELVQAVGGFSPELSQCADWDLWIRLRSETPFIYIDEPLATYRTHAANMSRNPQLLERDTLWTLERAFADKGLTTELKQLRNSSFAWNYRVMAATYWRTCEWASALRCLALALAHDWRTPFRLRRPSVRQ